jgi:hypothetical protein
MSKPRKKNALRLAWSRRSCAAWLKWYPWSRPQRVWDLRRFSYAYSEGRSANRLQLKVWGLEDPPLLAESGMWIGTALFHVSLTRKSTVYSFRLGKALGTVLVMLLTELWYWGELGAKLADNTWSIPPSPLLVIAPSPLSATYFT